MVARLHDDDEAAEGLHRGLDLRLGLGRHLGEADELDGRRRKSARGLSAVTTNRPGVPA